MKIVKNKLVEIDASDIKSGVLVLPKSVKEIGDSVIQYQPSLVKVIGKSVTAIGNDNFRV